MSSPQEGQDDIWRGRVMFALFIVVILIEILPDFWQRLMSVLR